MMKLKWIGALIPFFLMSCAEDSAEVGDDFFGTDGAADSTRMTGYRLTPEGGPVDLAPNDEILEEQLFYQPHESTILDDGTVRWTQPDDYWYQVRWYQMTVETRGQLDINATWNYPPSSLIFPSSLQLIAIRVWSEQSGRRQEVARDDNRLSLDSVPPGEYTITIEPRSFPTATEQELAYVEYDLTTTFTAE